MTVLVVVSAVTVSVTVVKLVVIPDSIRVTVGCSISCISSKTCCRQPSECLYRRDLKVFILLNFFVCEIIKFSVYVVEFVICEVAKFL